MYTATRVKLEHGRKYATPATEFNWGYHSSPRRVWPHLRDPKARNELGLLASLGEKEDHHTIIIVSVWGSQACTCNIVGFRQFCFRCGRILYFVIRFGRDFRVDGVVWCGVV